MVKSVKKEKKSHGAVRRSQRTLGTSKSYFGKRKVDNTPIVIGESTSSTNSSGWDDSKSISGEETSQQIPQSDYVMVPYGYNFDEESKNDKNVDEHAEENIVHERQEEAVKKQDEIRLKERESASLSKKQDMIVEEEDDEEDNIPIARRLSMIEKGKTMDVGEGSRKKRKSENLTDVGKAEKSHKRVRNQPSPKKDIEMGSHIKSAQKGSSSSKNKERILKTTKDIGKSGKRVITNETKKKNDKGKGKDLYKDAPLIVPMSSWNLKQKINIFGTYDVIKQIKNRLSAEEMVEFKKSIFGKFLDLDFKRFQSQLLYSILRRQCESNKKDELWFNLDGKIVKFGIEDYEKITGLDCKLKEEIDTEFLSGKFSKKYFKDRKSITRNDLADLFKDTDRLDKEDVVKVAMLYLFECFVDAKHLKLNVETDRLLLLEDMELFDEYPWGRKSYETTIKYLKAALHHPGSTTVGMGGFPYALLVWAYECIPLISNAPNMFARRKSNYSPLMINWEVDTQPKWTDLQTNVFGNKKFDFIPLNGAVEQTEVRQTQPESSNHSDELDRGNKSSSFNSWYDEEVDKVIEEMSKHTPINVGAETSKDADAATEEGQIPTYGMNTESINTECLSDMLTMIKELQSSLEMIGHKLDEMNTEINTKLDDLTKDVGILKSINKQKEDKEEDKEEKDSDVEEDKKDDDVNGPDDEDQDGGDNRQQEDVPHEEDGEGTAGKKPVMEEKEKKEDPEQRGMEDGQHNKNLFIDAIKGQGAFSETQIQKRKRRNLKPSKLMLSPYTTKFGSAEEKKKETNVDKENVFIEPPNFRILSQL